MADDERVEALGQTIAQLQEALHRKNVALDALHYVWCTGGCPGGVHRYDGQGAAPITDELVEAAMRNTERLVAYHGAVRFREHWGQFQAHWQADREFRRQWVELHPTWRHALPEAERE